MDSYDPCNPTESPELELSDDDVLLHSGSSSSASNHRENDLLKTAANTVPFLMEDSLIQRLENNDKNVSSTTNNDVRCELLFNIIIKNQAFLMYLPICSHTYLDLFI